MSIFSVILGEYGYNLSVALDNETAKDMVKQKKIDLIVIDFTFSDISPSSLFRTIVDLKPEIPKMIMIDKEMFEEPQIKEIYPYIYDIIVKPVVYIDDFRLRIKRAIENSKLLKENKEFQKIMVEKTFRLGLFDILSGILDNVNNRIDHLLADLCYWKDEYSEEIKDKNLLDKFDSYFVEIRNKILEVEETIQLNEVLLSEYKSETGIEIDNMIKDILQTLSYSLNSNNITLIANCEKVLVTKLESSKLILCLFHLINNSIYSLKNSPLDNREIIVQCKNIISNKNRKMIEITISDNGSQKYNDLESIFNEKFDIKNKMFDLFNVKKYIDSIDGEIKISSSVEDNFGANVTLRLPIK